MNRKSLALGLLAAISVSGITQGMDVNQKSASGIPQGISGNMKWFGITAATVAGSLFASNRTDLFTGFPGFGLIGMGSSEVGLAMTTGCALFGGACLGSPEAAKGLAWLPFACGIFKLFSSDLVIGAIAKANLWHLGDAIEGSDSARYLLGGLVAMGAYRIMTQANWGRQYENKVANFFCGKLVTQSEAAAKLEAAAKPEAADQL